jgi:hypothetical protein
LARLKNLEKTVDHTVDGTVAVDAVDLISEISESGGSAPAAAAGSGSQASGAAASGDLGLDTRRRGCVLP